MPRSRRQPQPVATVAEIARQTGLSPSSVSAVLNGNHVQRRIAPATAERVRAVAHRLRYVPNITARSLRAKDSARRQIVLSLLTSYEAPFSLIGEVLRVMEPMLAQRASAEVDFTVTVEVFSAGRLQHLAGLRDGHRCNAAIISNTIDADDQFLASTRLPFPVVMLGRRILGYPGVSVKSELMGRQAAEILLGACRRNLAVLQPAMLTQATRSRLSAFIAAVRQATGRPPTAITCNALTERSGHEAMARFLACNPACDGIFALSDILAIGAYRAIRESGRTIPRHLALIGVGDHAASPYLDPPLSGFEDAQEAQNRAAVQMLLDLVNGIAPEPPTLELPVAPILRASTDT